MILKVDDTKLNCSSVSHHSGLLPEPLGVPFVLTVHFHLLRSQRHAAVAVEVQAVVAADVSTLLFLFSIFRLQEL